MSQSVDLLKGKLLAALESYTEEMLRIQREAYELANAAARKRDIPEMEKLMQFRDHTLGNAFDEALTRGWTIKKTL